MRLLRCFVYWWVWWGRNATYYYSRPFVWLFRRLRSLPQPAPVFVMPERKGYVDIFETSRGMYRWDGRAWNLHTGSAEFSRKLRAAERNLQVVKRKLRNI